MKYLIWTVIIFLCSCNKCANDDCPNNATFKFKINDQNGNNLLLLDDQPYSFGSLEIHALRNGELIQLNTMNRTDFVEVPTLTDQTGIVIDYGGMEMDTLEVLNRKLNEDDCCGKILEDFTVKLNEDILCQRCSTTMAIIEKVL